MDHLATSFLAFCAGGAGRPLIVGLLLAGLASGFTHCAAMCTPLLLTAGGGRARLPDALALHGGRLVAYAALGAASAAANRLIWSDGLFRIMAFILVCASAFVMVMAALPPTRLMMAQGLATLYRPIAPGLYRAVARLRELDAPLRMGLTGLLFAFMPCSMIIGALLAVSAAGKPAVAAAGMAAFVLGTLPGLMLATGAVDRARARWPRQSQWIEPFAMAACAALLITHAWTILP